MNLMAIFLERNKRILQLTLLFAAIGLDTLLLFVIKISRILRRTKYHAKFRFEHLNYRTPQKISKTRRVSTLTPYFLSKISLHSFVNITYNTSVIYLIFIFRYIVLYTYLCRLKIIMSSMKNCSLILFIIYRKQRNY